MFNANTSHPDCPVRIMYTEELTGDALHANGLDGFRWNLRPLRPLAVIRATEFSDYSGSAVERSNYRVILGDCREGTRRPGIVEIYGSQGYRALAYDATLGPVPADDELCEFLEGLESCPVLDDDDHSELEAELESDAWDEHGRRDFRVALTQLLDVIDGDHEHELPGDDEAYSGVAPDADRCFDPDPETWKTLLWDLWRAGCYQYNINGGTGFEIETGCTVHFYTDSWVTRAERKAPARPIDAVLESLAVACRVTEGE